MLISTAFTNTPTMHSANIQGVNIRFNKGVYFLCKIILFIKKTPPQQHFLQQIPYDSELLFCCINSLYSPTFPPAAGKKA